jgi:hypothetical protein
MNTEHNKYVLTHLRVQIPPGTLMCYSSLLIILPTAVGHQVTVQKIPDLPVQKTWLGNEIVTYRHVQSTSQLSIPEPFHGFYEENIWRS